MPSNLTPDAEKLWLEVRNPDCEECVLYDTAPEVCSMGNGPVPADVMVVGEIPESGGRFNRPRTLLEEGFAEVGIDPEQIYYTSVVKCRTPDGKAPSRSQIKACRPYLDAELERVQPKFILTLGNSGLSVVRKSGIMKHRGEMLQLGEGVVFPTVHPAAVLRNPKFTTLLKTDLQTFSRIVKGEKGAPPPKMILVKDRKSLAMMLKAIMNSEAVAYDLETTGFEEYAPEAAIVTVAVSTEPGLSYVAAISHPEATWKHPERVLGAITVALAHTPAKRIAHNAKFDDKWLSHFGQYVRADFDTMIAAHIIDENRPKGLKVLAPIYLGVDPWAGGVDLANGGAMREPLNQLSFYNAKDSDYTLRLYYKMRDQLKAPENIRSLRLFQKLLMPASRALTDIEMVGVYVDRKRLLDRTIEVNKKVQDLDKRLTEVFGEQVNWNSSQVIADLLFNKLGLPVFDMTAAGRPSTKESVLLRLRTEHEAAQLLLDWRKWSKFLSTYLERWGEIVDGEGRIHPNYKVTGTVTGRLSSGKEEGNKGRGLNVQQVPRDPIIRGILGAPDGWKFVEADFSQVELRLAAHYSGDPTMQRLYQLGEDVHLQTAMTMLSKPADQISKEERKKAKAVNFGFLYGMGAKKFVDYSRDSYDVVVTMSEAEKFRDRYFDTFTSLRPWHERQRRLVRKYKRVQSAIGRVRHLTDVDSHDKEVAAEAERQSINSPVQSLASDLMLLSMVILHEEMDPAEAKIIGTVHDALLFEIRDDVVDKWTARIKEVMEDLPIKKKFGATLSVPIVVDIKVGQHWGEGEEI